MVGSTPRRLHCSRSSRFSRSADPCHVHGHLVCMGSRRPLRSACTCTWRTDEPRMGRPCWQVPKLMRLGRLFKSFERIEGAANVGSIIILLVIMCLMNHWVSCLWFLCTKVTQCPRLPLALTYPPGLTCPPIAGRRVESALADAVTRMRTRALACRLPLPRPCLPHHITLPRHGLGSRLAAPWLTSFARLHTAGRGRVGGGPAARW